MDKGATEPILAGRNLSKRFDRAVALNDVSLALHPGEVVGLVGENGAGKSTLIKLLSGAWPPDSGQILYFGREIPPGSPGLVRGLGIETVYQEPALVGEMDIEGNIFLGREPVLPLWGGALALLDREQMRREAGDVLRRLGINIEMAGQKVCTLSEGRKRAVAIARAVYWQAKAILMDEPTAHLGIGERYRVLSLIRTLRERGIAMLIAGHEPADVLAVADRVIVLQRGRKVAERQVVGADKQEIVELMSGNVG